MRGAHRINYKANFGKRVREGLGEGERKLLELAGEIHFLASEL